MSLFFLGVGWNGLGLRQKRRKRFKLNCVNFNFLTLTFRKLLVGILSFAEKENTIYEAKGYNFNHLYLF